MTFEQLIAFLTQHLETIIGIISLVLTYVGYDVRKQRSQFRKDIWLRAGAIAFQALEFGAARLQLTGTEKAKLALQLAVDTMNVWELDPTEEEKDRWLKLWASSADTTKAAGGQSLVSLLVGGQGKR